MLQLEKAHLAEIALDVCDFVTVTVMTKDKKRLMTKAYKSEKLGIFYLKKRKPGTLKPLVTSSLSLLMYKNHYNDLNFKIRRTSLCQLFAVLLFLFF